jgi:hypothetical protein
LKTQTSVGTVAKGVALGTAAWSLFKQGVGETTEFLKSCISEFEKDEEVNAKFYEAVSHTKEGMESWSKVLNTSVNNALKNTTFSMEEVTTALTGMAHYGIDSSKAAKMLAVAEDASAGSGMSLSTIMTSLQRASQGMVGKGLVPLGVNLAEVKKSSDKLGDTMKQLSDRFGGDAAIQAQTLAGQIKRLNNNIDEAKSSIAAQFVPALNAILGKILGLNDALGDNSDAMVKVQAATYRVVEALKMFYDSLKFTFELIQEGLVLLIDGVAELPAMFVAAVVDCIKNLSKIGEAFKTLGTNIIGEMKSWIPGSKKAVWDPMPQIAFTATAATKKVFDDMTTHFTQNLGKTASDIKNDFMGMTTGAGFAFKTIGENAKAGSDVAGDVVDTLTNKLKSAKDAVTSFASGIDDAMSKIQDDIATTTSDYQKSQVDAASSEKDSIAAIIKTHQDKAKTLKEQLRQETELGQEQDEGKIAQTKSELQTELDFLNKHSSDVASVQDVLNADEIDKEKNKYAKQRTDAEDAYNKKLTDLKSQLEKENQAYDDSLAKQAIDFKGNWDEILTYIKSNATPAIVAAFQVMADQANIALAKIGLPALNLSSATSSTSTPGKTFYRVGKDIFNADTGVRIGATDWANNWSGQATEVPGKNQYAMGGIIGETGLQLLHAGEMVVPRSQVSGISSASNINVNFYGGMTLTKEADEDRLVSKIRTTLLHDFEMAQRGLY